MAYQKLFSEKVNKLKCSALSSCHDRFSVELIICRAGTMNQLIEKKLCQEREV